MMPQGNVGTPTMHFLDAIQKCKLPANLINKLGLRFPKQNSNKRYGNVPYNYDSDDQPCGSVAKNEQIVGAFAPNCDDTAIGEAMTATGLKLKSLNEKRVKYIQQRKRDRAAVKRAKLSEPQEQGEGQGQGQDEDSNSDGEEDWERLERLHENTFEQDRIKDRLFEEEVELVWEKGGSGLVFYCDSALWDEAKGDFDERTTDDLDVDMSLYWKGQGSNADADARAFAEMRKNQMIEMGKGNKIAKRNFEGYAQELMRKQGWRPGQSLGRSQPGIVQPIEAEGQKPSERRGFGYHGEKLDRTAGSSKFHRSEKLRAENTFRISTVYDKVTREDVSESLLQWAPATANKIRFLPGGVQ